MTLVPRQIKLRAGTMSSRKTGTTTKKPKYYSDERVLEKFYETLASGDGRKLARVHIPKSDVFYAREAYYQHSGEWVTLDRMERAMYLEGMLERRDVLDPDRVRDWEHEYVSAKPEKPE